METKVIKTISFSKPYINNDLKNLIREKNKLKRKYAKHPITYEKEYKLLRNKVTDRVRKSKAEYYNKKLHGSSGDSRATWKVINEILHPRGNKQICTEFNKISDVTNEPIENECLNHPNDIVNEFNNYYLGVAESLSSKIIDNNISYETFLGNRVQDTFSFELVNEREVGRLIGELGETAAGYDQLPARVIKYSRDYILTPLTHIINCSLRTGIFPSKLKIARICPIYKSGDKHQFLNYRPISILPIFSKIFEKIMYNQLERFLDNHNIISPHQFGFRKNKSTQAAIISLTDYILKSFDNNNSTIGLFLDLSKAFDTVNHSILLGKLKHYGIRGIAFDLLHSYLHKRQQFTNYNNHNSNYNFIIHSVPQGSLLGPLLFNLYINDLLNSTLFLKSILFADDSCFYLSGTDLSSMINYVNLDLIRINNWLISNKLTLNLVKSHYIIFSRKKIIGDTPVLKINENIINKVAETKFLGITLQSNLSWHNHITNITNKLNKYCSILYLTRNSLTKSSMKSIYNSIIYSQLTYCNVIWGKMKKIHLHKLEVAQKRVIRTIMYRSKYAHTLLDFISLKILKIKEINIYFSSLFVYKSIHSLSYPIAYFTFANQHNYNLRNTYNLRPPFSRSLQGQTSPSIYTCNIWNELPQQIREATTLFSFRSSVKRYLLNLYN